MLPVSQILKRNNALFDSGSWLIVNPGEAEWLNFCNNPSITVLHQYFDVFQVCTQLHEAIKFDSESIVSDPKALFFEKSYRKHRHIFAPFITEGEYENILLVMPKSKAQLSFLVAMATARLTTNGQIYIVGENRSGIKSLSKVLSDNGQINKIDSARHCTLLQLTPKFNQRKFNPLELLQINCYSLDSSDWYCASFPGVFSDGKLDDGTALLLASIPSSTQGYSLDFACGAGVIATFLMKFTQCQTVDLSDVSALALFAAAHTLDANQLQSTLIAANGLKGIEQQYKNIVTNPPFHTGIKTDYQISSEFIENSVHSLQKAGKLFVVANRFLPYLDQLRKHFNTANILAQTSKFTVYSNN